MRYGLLVCALLVGPALAVGQSVLERAAGLDVRNEPIESALRLLQRNAGVSLAFSPDMLPRGLLVSCPCVELTVADALTHILEGTGLGLVSSGSVITVGPLPRTGVIVGRVVEAEDNAPVANALVSLEEKRGVFTGRDGLFTFGSVRPGVHRIRVTALGWRIDSLAEQIVAAGDTAKVILTLVRDAVPLAGIVVEPGTFGLLEGVSPGTARTLTRREIRTVPQLGVDAFRTMKYLPGAASSDISTKLSVRGGMDREILVQLDGLELYEPYHVLDWDGALGIVDINALGAAQLLSGGFGVRHGDKLTGVFDLKSRQPEAGTRSSLGLSISNVSAANRGTFDRGSGAWLVSARRGFLDLVMDLANEGRRLSPRYHDLFAKLRYEFGSSHRVSARFLYAGDRFLLRDPDVVDLDAVDFESAWDSMYGWLTWEFYPGPSISATTMIWLGQLGRQRTGEVEDVSDSPSRVTVSNRRDFSFAGVKSDVSVDISERLLLEFGAEGKLLDVDYDYSRQSWTPFVSDRNTREVRVDTLAMGLRPGGHEIATYATIRFRPVSKLTAEVGVRHDAFSHTNENTFAPRVLAAFEVTRRTNFKVSAGRYFQSHGLHELDVGDGESTFSRSAHGDQVAMGLDHTLPHRIGLRLEVYLRDIRHRRPTFINFEQELKIFPEAAADRIRFDADRGRARGLELSIERETGDRWTWSASYVWALAQDRVQGEWVPRLFDQRHSMLLRTAYMPNEDWIFSLGWRFHSGWPATSWSWDVQTLDDGWNFWTRRVGELRGVRLPPYHRLDVRINREFTFSRGRILHVYVDLFNVYNRTNLGSWDYAGTFEGGNLTVERVNGQEMLPFLPTVGILYEF